MNTLTARLVAGLMACERVITGASVWCGCAMMAAAAYRRFLPGADPLHPQ